MDCKMRTLVRLLFASALAVAAALPSAAKEYNVCMWNMSTGSSNLWWYANLDYWVCTTFVLPSGPNTPREPAFPRATDVVWIGTNARQSPWVYLKDGDNVSVLGVNIGYGNWSGNRSLLEVQKGAFLRMTGNVNANWEGLQFSYQTHANGYLWINGGTVVSSGTRIAGHDEYCTSRLRITNGGIMTNVYLGASSLVCPITIEVDNGTFVNRNGSIDFGGLCTCTIANGSYFQPSTGISFNKGSHTVIADSRVEEQCSDWAKASPPVSFSASIEGTTTGVYVTNSTWVVYDPAWDKAQSATNPKGASGYRWGEWYRMEFYSSAGQAEFVQKDTTVTNNGVWFRTSTNADGLVPRYVVDGGELYVYNFWTESSPDTGAHQSDGSAYMGFAAANDAPNSGTIEFLNQAKVSFPSINTNIVVSGNITALKYAITTNRPHLKFTLAKGGHRPAEIRVQTDVMGMYSFEPQGGLQVVQTNRFALLRHRNKTKTLTTCNEPQFRAPNADLWTTGGFADTPYEWGVTMKPEKEIVEGADLGSGVSSGFMMLPRCNPDALDRALLILEMTPGEKTLKEVAADLTAAGYPATVNGDDEVIVDLKASGKPARDFNARLLFDFTAPQNAIAVRDGVKVVNALVRSATTVGMHSGLTVIFW